MPLILPSRLLGRAASASFREATEPYTSVETGYDDPGTQATNPARLVAPVPTVPMPEPAPARATEPATSVELPPLDELIPDSWRDAAGTATTAVQGAAQQARSFGEQVLGSVDDWIPEAWKPPAPAQSPPGMPSGFTGTPQAMPTGAPTAGGVADVRPDEEVTRESVTRSAAAALTKAGLPVGMAPYVAGIAINEGILQPGTIARDYWSVGGVKADAGQGTVTVPTREVINGQSVMQQGTFGRFNSMQDGMDALAAFIRDSPRFGPVARQAAQTGDYSGLIAGFHQQGYATDPNWTSQVNAIAAGLPVPAVRPQPTTPTQAEQTPEAQAQARGFDPKSITQAYAGQPYVFGGAGGRSDPRLGVATDCSGFVSAVWQNQFGLSLPAHTDAAYNALRQSGAPEVSAKDARPGDVVFYMGAGTGGAITHHMGIYAGPGKVLDMSTSGGDGVRERDLGHAGRFVILRDPRVNAEPSRTASVPPPIVETGIAEQTGGEKLTQPEIARISLNADSAASPSALSAAPAGPEGEPPAPSGPTALIGVPMPEDASQSERYADSLNTTLPTLGPPMRNDVPYDPETGFAGWPGMQKAPLDGGSVPVRDNWASEPQYDPRDADQGAHEAPADLTYDPRIQDEAPGARELPAQLVAVPQAPVGGQDDPGTQVTTPQLVVPQGRSVGRSWDEPPVTPERAPVQAAIDTVLAPGRAIGDAITGQIKPEGLLEPAGGAPRQLQRMEEIEIKAAQDMGHDLSTAQGFLTRRRAVEDPAWRARNPDLASEYDQLRQQFGLNVVGQTGDAARIPGMADDAGRAARQAARALPEGALPIRLTPAEEVARLNLERFPEDVRPLIQQAAEDAGWYHAQRRGVLPDDVVARMADEAGSRVEQAVRAAQVGRGGGHRAWSPEETVALRNAVAGQGVLVNDLAEAVQRAGSAEAPGLIAEFTAQAGRLSDLVGVMEGARAEAGRSLRQWGLPANPIDNPGAFAQSVIKKFGGDTRKALGAIGEYNQMVRDGASPAQLAGFINRVMADPVAPAEVFALYRRFNMLSGPRTFEVNAVSGALELAYDGVQRAGLRAASGHPGEAADIVAAPFLALQRAGRNFVQTLAHGITDEQAARGDLPRALSSRLEPGAGRVAATVLEIPDRINAATDQFVRTLAEQMIGVDEALRATRGLAPEARAARMAELLAAPTPELARAIKEGADRITFQGDLGRLGQALRGVQQVPIVGNLVLPFLTTIYHIGARGIDRSPVGLLTTAQELIRSAPGIEKVGKGAYRAGIERPAGVPALGARLRDNAIGTATAAWAYDQAERGNITGMGPDDPEKRAELRATGWQPYSIKVGDQYWSYANLGPLAFPLTQAAAASEARRYAKDDATTAAMIGDAGKRFAMMMTEASVVSGIGSIAKSLSDPERYGGQWLTQALQTLIPAGSLLNTVGQATDPLVRRAERTDLGTQIGQNLEARVPALRQAVPPAQDPLGRDIRSEQTGLRALNPLRPTTARDEPVIRAFLDAKVDIGKPKETLTLKQGASVELTPAEQRQWNTARGEAIQQIMREVERDPGYRSATTAGKQATLRRVLDSAGQMADRQLISSLGEAEITRRMKRRAP